MSENFKDLVQKPSFDIEMTFLDCFDGRGSQMYRIGFGNGLPETPRQFAKLFREIEEAIAVLDGDDKFARHVASLREGLKWAALQRKRLTAAEKLRRAAEEAQDASLDNWQVHEQIGIGQERARRKAQAARKTGSCP